MELTCDRMKAIGSEPEGGGGGGVERPRLSASSARRREAQARRMDYSSSGSVAAGVFLFLFFYICELAVCWAAGSGCCGFWAVFGSQNPNSKFFFRHLHGDLNLDKIKNALRLLSVNGETNLMNLIRC